MHCCSVPPLREKDSNDVRISAIPSGLRSRCAANSVPKNLISNLSSAYLWLCPTYDAIFRTTVTIHWVTVFVSLGTQHKKQLHFSKCDSNVTKNVIGLCRGPLSSTFSTLTNIRRSPESKRKACVLGVAESTTDKISGCNKNPTRNFDAASLVFCLVCARSSVGGQYMNQAYADNAQVLRSTPATAEGHQLCWCLVPSELCLTVPPIPCKPPHQLPRTARCWTDGRRVVDAILVQLYFVFVWLLRKSRNAPQTG